MQPVIGITMCYDHNNLIHQGISYSYIRQEYGKNVRAAGGQPIFLDASIDPVAAAQLCDGILISGGEDIAPSFYGQAHRFVKNIEPVERTSWEGRLIDACDDSGVPILGVCYGAQLLNVHYGGTLYQDIAEEHGSAMDHGTGGAAALHKVTFEQDFLGFEASDEVQSASRHHQAVRDLAPGFRVVARAEDGIIEAIAGHGHYGIQWHAESDGTAPKIYGQFVRVCGSNQLVVSAAQPEKIKIV